MTINGITVDRLGAHSFVVSGGGDRACVYRGQGDESGSLADEHGGDRDCDFVNDLRYIEASVFFILPPIARIMRNRIR